MSNLVLSFPLTFPPNLYSHRIFKAEDEASPSLIISLVRLHPVKSRSRQTWWWWDKEQAIMNIHVSSGLSHTQVMIRIAQGACLDVSRDSKQPSLFIGILDRYFTRSQNMEQLSPRPFVAGWSDDLFPASFGFQINKGNFEVWLHLSTIGTLISSTDN